jgi:CotS family spore coat protein
MANELLAHWPLVPVEIRQFKDVFRVRTVDGDFVLKPLNKTRRRARYLAGLMEHMGSRPGALTPALVRTKSGSALVSEHSRRYWIICRWIGGRTCEWSSLDDIRLCTAALAGFHQAARGYLPGAGQRPRSYFNRWPEKLANRRAAISRHLREARRRYYTGIGNEFDALVVEHGPMLIGWADQARLVLEASAYPELCQRYEAMQQVVHGDPAGRNFVVTEFGRVRIIDLETCRQDLPAIDVAKLLRRALKKFRWRPEVAEDLLRAYTHQSPLEPELLPVMWAFLAFPTKFYRDLTRYYEERPGWTLRHHLAKLRKHLRQIRRQDAFLDWAYAKFVDPAGWHRQ